MSKHLQEIIDNYNQIGNCQVVFLDIEKYSKRRSTNQVSVINVFTALLKQTIKDMAKDYIDEVQKNEYNFLKDIILLPTGDGAAVVFTFDGVSDIHFNFAKQFIKNLHTHNSKNKCSKFDENKWCNCHDNFNIRIAINEGKAVVYKDITDRYNVAGNSINIAARLLGEIDGNQIILSEESYNQLIDLTDNPHLDEEFLCISNLKVKHGVKLNGYLYSGKEEYINSALPDKHIINGKLQDITQLLKDAGLPFPDIFGDNTDHELDKMNVTEKLDFLGNLNNLAKGLKGSKESN